MPSKMFIFWFGVWTSILMLVGAGTINFTDALPAELVPVVTKWCINFALINNTIMTALQGFPTAQGLPEVKLDALKKTAAVVAVLFLSVVAFMLTLSSARAADMPSKAPKASGVDAIFNGYPYGTSGFFFGIYTEGGSAGVTGSVPGVGSASLTSTSAGVGGTVGYAWGSKNSNVAYSVEADFGWTNINGNNAGFAFSGPVSFEQRFVAFTPLANLLSMLPGLPSLGAVPPFPTAPTGVTTSNIQMGLMAGIDEVDISPNFPGVATGHQWRIAPMIGLVAMEQLSNGAAARAWVKTVFPADKSVCVGPVKDACVNLGQQVKVGVGIYW